MKEIDAYSRSCERLIAAALLIDAIPFTVEEIEWIAYCRTEMTNLVDQLLRNSRPQIDHKRQTIGEFSRACEALLLMDDFTEEERDSIRHSISEITMKILADKQDPALER